MLPPFYADFLRENLYSSMYWRQLGTVVTIPKGHGTKARISNWHPSIKPVASGMSALALTAIASYGENVVLTAAKNMSAESITGYITAYEGAYGYTQKTLLVGMANVTEGALENLGRELAWRTDTYHRTKCSGGAWTVYALCSVGSGVPTDNKVNSYCRLHSKTLASIGPKFGTLGIPRWSDGTYVGIAHEIAQYDMMIDSSAYGYVPVARYNDARRVYRGEIGEFYGVRWLLSPTSVLRNLEDGTTSATTGLSAAVSGSNAYVFSPDSFYCLELADGGVEVINQPLGSGGATGDPTAKVGTIGVNVYFGNIATPSTDNRIMRLVHSCSIRF
jgi:N4-gp56 family major capsid protein